MTMKYPMFLVSLFLFTAGQTVFGHAHIHIGINYDQTNGTDDDTQLFLFGMPTADQPEDYWPNFPVWGDEDNPYDMTSEPLKLVYQTSGIFAGKYVCEWLECFHSAHPEHGNWQLGGTDSETSPAWSIGIERISASDGLEFWDEDTFCQVLENDGDSVLFSQLWMNDKYNEDGTLGAWGLHQHILFAVDGTDVEVGQEFYLTIQAFDAGTTGYVTSEAYMLRFVTIPEPATALLTAFGLIRLIRRKKISA